MISKKQREIKEERYRILARGSFGGRSPGVYGGTTPTHDPHTMGNYSGNTE